MATEADSFEDGDDAFDTGNLPMDDEEQDNIEVKRIILYSYFHFLFNIIIEPFNIN